MSDFLSSDVITKREPAPVRTLPDLPTAVPCWVGLTERGPVGVPTEVFSYDGFVRTFGSLISTAKVPLSVRQAFLGGVRKGVVMRILAAGYASAAVTLDDITLTDALTVTASSPGTWGNGLTVSITAPTSGEALHYDLILKKNGVIVEAWPNVSMVSANADYVETVINNATTGSIYITVDALGTALPVVVADAALIGGLNNSGTAPADADYTGGDNFALLEAEEITLLAVPDQPTTAVQIAMAAYAEVTKSREVHCIFDPPMNSTAAAIRAHKASLGASEQYTLYWPNIKIPNPSKTIYGSDDEIVVPPSGAIMGMMARNDSTYSEGPFRQPAGTEDGVLTGVTGVERPEVKRKSVRNEVFPERINPIRIDVGTGNVYVDGARTGKGDGDFPSTGESRGVGDIERTFRVGLQFIRHRNNTEETRGLVERTMRGELLARTKNGCFASKTPSEAFVLDADIPGLGLNDARTRAQKKLFARWGIATAQPAEFVVLLASQDTRALREASGG